MAGEVVVVGRSVGDWTEECEFAHPLALVVDVPDVPRDVAPLSGGRRQGAVMRARSGGHDAYIPPSHDFDGCVQLVGIKPGDEVLAQLLLDLIAVVEDVPV